MARNSNDSFAQQKNPPRPPFAKEAVAKGDSRRGPWMAHHFQRLQAVENEGIEKSHFSIPCRKRPWKGVLRHPPKGGSGSDESYELRGQIKRRSFLSNHSVSSFAWPVACIFLARSANKFAATLGRRHFGAAVLAALWLALGLAGTLHAEPAPLDDKLQAVGSGHLSWWGIGVYDATLYSDDGRYRPQRPHALRIDYQISVSAAKLAERSLDEIEEIFGEQPKRQRMVASLQALFCDVEEGDAIIGYHYPGEGAEFYCNGQRIGRLEDAKLAAAFFAIWLHPRTSEPELRRQLLGESS